MVAGENCNVAAWDWLNDVIGGGRCKVVDCWWQTETGALMMSPTPCPNDESAVPSTATRGFYGILCLEPCHLYLGCTGSEASLVQNH